jgi:hypothetical protein
VKQDPRLRSLVSVRSYLSRFVYLALFTSYYSAVLNKCGVTTVSVRLPVAVVEGVLQVEERAIYM